MVVVYVPSFLWFWYVASLPIIFYYSGCIFSTNYHEYWYILKIHSSDNHYKKFRANCLEYLLCLDSTKDCIPSAFTIITFWIAQSVQFLQFQPIKNFRQQFSIKSHDCFLLFCSVSDQIPYFASWLALDTRKNRHQGDPSSLSRVAMSCGAKCHKNRYQRHCHRVHTTWGPGRWKTGHGRLVAVIRGKNEGYSERNRSHLICRKLSSPHMEKGELR